MAKLLQGAKIHDRHSTAAKSSSIPGIKDIYPCSRAYWTNFSRVTRLVSTPWLQGFLPKRCSSSSKNNAAVGKEKRLGYSYSTRQRRSASSKALSNSAQSQGCSATRRSWATKVCVIGKIPVSWK